MKRHKFYIFYEPWVAHHFLRYYNLRQTNENICYIRMSDKQVVFKSDWRRRMIKQVPFRDISINSRRYVARTGEQHIFRLLVLSSLSKDQKTAHSYVTVMSLTLAQFFTNAELIEKLTAFSRKWRNVIMTFFYVLFTFHSNSFISQFYLKISISQYISQQKRLMSTI